MALEVKNCPICGSSEIVFKEGHLICKSCDAVFSDEHETIKDQQKWINIYQAEEKLKLQPPRFDEAEEEFDYLIKEYPNWYAPYWGKVRAVYGIKYEQDTDGSSVPSCYKSEYKDFRKDKNFIKACELAPKDIKEKIIFEAERIAKVYKEWSEKARQHSFDVFLSFKNTDEETGKQTEDTIEMSYLYNYLKDRGLKVFFAPISMKEVAGISKFDAYIFNALEKAEVLIVYGSKPEYFESTWVQNEWMRYLRQIERGEKDIDSIIPIYDGFDINDLPKRLRGRQCCNGKQKSLWEDIYKRCDGILSRKRNKKVVEHIEVERVAPGVKKSTDKSNVELIEAGTRVIQKKHFVNEIGFKAQELSNSGSGLYTLHIKEKLNIAATCLQNNSYDEANSFYDECLNDDNYNGQAWFGKLAVKLKDYELLQDFELDNVFKPRMLSSKESLILGECLGEIKNVIECADSKRHAERSLEIFTSTFLNSLITNYKKAPTGDGEFVRIAFELFKIINSYKSHTRKCARDIIVKNFEAFFEANMLDDFAAEIVDTIDDGNLDDYLDIVERVINIFEKNNAISSAEKWNNKRLKHYDGELSSVIRSIFFSFGCTDDASFLNQNFGRDKNVSVKTIEIVLKHINSMSKRDVATLFTFLCNIEISCLDNGTFEASLSNAENYFRFLIQYSFDNRASFINSHTKYLSLLADKKHNDFVMLILENISSTDPDYHIKLLYDTANVYRKNSSYLAAKALYSRIFTIQENNFLSLEGLFYCDIGFNDNDYENIKTQYITSDRLESIIKYAPSSKKQQAFIKKVLSICVKTIKVNPGSPSYNTQASKAFDVTLKYLSVETDDEKYNYLDNIAFVCLSSSEFALANQYAQLSLKNKPIQNILAWMIVLYSRLHCCDDSAFIVSMDFSKEMQEYKNLIAACVTNNEQLTKYTRLATINQENQIRIRKNNELSAKIQNCKKELEKKNNLYTEKMNLVHSLEQKSERIDSSLRHTDMFMSIALIPGICFTLLCWLGGCIIHFNEGTSTLISLLHAMVFPVIGFVPLLVGLIINGSLVRFRDKKFQTIKTKAYKDYKDSEEEKCAISHEIQLLEKELEPLDNGTTTNLKTKSLPTSLNNKVFQKTETNEWYIDINNRRSSKKN